MDMQVTYLIIINSSTDKYFIFLLKYSTEIY